MAARGISSDKSFKAPGSFSMALASAVLEWLLISMLIIDAIFSYLVTKFARYCKLPVPCLLCSRLDHVLGNEKLGFYWDMVCGNHKLELSSLVLCHEHNKLVDVHGMCENCLFSFATINKSNTETYRLLVGKLGADSHLGLDQVPLFEEHKLGSPSTRNCSCCNEPWILRSHAPNLFQTKSIGSEVAELGLPLPVAPEHNWDDLKKSREETSGSLRAYNMGKSCFDPLSHIEYTQVKITSDTESEVPFSDDDDGSTLIHETADLKDDTSVQCVKMEPCIITLANDLTSEKFIHLDSAPEFSLIDLQMQLDGKPSVASTASSGHGLEELNWAQVDHKVNASAATDFASVDEVSQSSNIMDTLVEESTVCLDALGTGEMEQKCVTESGIFEAESSPVTRSETSTEINPIISDTNSQMPYSLDLGDAYKLAVGKKGRQLSGKFSEQRSLKDSARVSEDLKLLLSQISAARGIELLLNDMSPRMSGNRDELKTDSSSSIGIHILQRRISLERNESGLSLDGSIVSEIEGESEVDRLKRQVEHDKKLMGALYKELEEERNASAIAANQAMAMITRLQEEKAALNMEALQCVRMMEEQAEYDVEALQKASDLLAEKEKEIQDMEAELELYRNKVDDASILENEVESTCDLQAGEVKAEHLDASCFKNSGSVQTSSITNKALVCTKVDGTEVFFGDKNTDSSNNSLVESEDERLYILQCLKKLEKKLHLFLDDGVHLDMANDEYSGIKGNGLSDLKELNCKGGTQETSGKEENDSSLQKHISLSEESPCAQEGCVPSFENPEFVSMVSGEFVCRGQCYSRGCRLTDVVTLGDAVSNLIGRLAAIEADHYCLEHSCKSVRRGDDELEIHSGDILSPMRTMNNCD